MQMERLDGHCVCPGLIVRETPVCRTHMLIPEDVHFFGIVLYASTMTLAVRFLLLISEFYQDTQYAI